MQQHSLKIIHQLSLIQNLLTWKVHILYLVPRCCSDVFFFSFKSEHVVDRSTGPFDLIVKFQHSLTTTPHDYYICALTQSKVVVSIIFVVFIQVNMKFFSLKSLFVSYFALKALSCLGVILCKCVFLLISVSTRASVSVCMDMCYSLYSVWNENVYFFCLRNNQMFPRKFFMCLRAREL